jgi:uncharacterized protein (TIGR02118 family)
MPTSSRRREWHVARIACGACTGYSSSIRPPTDPDHFRSYYEGTHLNFVAKIPGLLGYRYGFDVAAGDGDSPYFCVFEGDFDDAEAMGAGLASPAGQAALADIPNYATGGATALNYEVRTASKSEQQS